MWFVKKLIYSCRRKRYHGHGETQYDAEVKKKAEADRYAVEQAAEADKAKRMREADAVQYSIRNTCQSNS